MAQRTESHVVRSWWRRPLEWFDWLMDRLGIN
jgi:hypothetical protein